MPLSVLDIVRGVAAENRFEVPNSLFENRPLSLLALSLARVIGEEIATHGAENGWPALLREASTPLYPTQADLALGEYRLPADCYKLYSCSVYERSPAATATGVPPPNSGAQSGPISPAQSGGNAAARAADERITNLVSPVSGWAMLQGAVAGLGSTRYRTIRHTGIGETIIQLHPAPVVPDGYETGDAAPTLTYTYLSTHWVKRTDGSTTDSITADTDTLLIPVQVFRLGLSARWLMKEDREYATELSMYEQERDKYLGDQHGAWTLSINAQRHRRQTNEPPWNWTLPDSVGTT